MSKKLSRRDFARTSVAAGAAAAVALPTTLFGESAVAAPAAAETTGAASTTAAASGASVARRRLASLPPQGFAYGGDPASSVAEFRDSIVFANSVGMAGQQKLPTDGSWAEGLTIPSEYYIDEKHFPNDERFLGESLWFMADHVNRIPNPGDYFVFEYGRGDSVIVLRDKAGEVKGFHNVCRHRGSRMARHDDDPAPKDARLSVKQLGANGNTPVFRCPYHAWTYDLSGALISAPNGMPSSFDMAKNGLRPAHVKTSEGFIFVNLSLDATPPDFDAVVKSFAAVAKEYGTADLKIVARTSAPTKANWKLVLENFQECYHCGPAHRSLVTTHPFWDGTMAQEQRARLAKELERFAPPRTPGQGGQGVQGSGQGGGMAPAAPGAGYGGNVLGVNMVSGTLDGKACAPLLPARKEWTHRSRAVSTAWSTGYLQCYDDHVAAGRFTPRSVKMTDAEIFWLVRADAKPKDVNIQKMKDLWELTYLEDRWITENNHQGIESAAYSPGPYAAVETGPSRFVKWYMTEVVPAAAKLTNNQ
jgi:phenylpropionate dioxygenase-like ring-hydroxylating dioxygenase large terminal subunit